MLQRRGEGLEVLDRLLAAGLVARAQRGPDHLLEQRRLAVGRGAQHAQVAPGDAEAGELAARLDDLAVGVVVEALAVDLLRAGRCATPRARGSARAPTPVWSTSSSRSMREPCRRRRWRRGASRPSRLRRPASLRSAARRRAPGGSPAAAGTRRAACAGSRAAARRRPGCRGGSRRACAAARAASGPRGSGSSRSRCRRTRGRGSWRRRRSSAPCESIGLCRGLRQTASTRSLRSTLTLSR